MKRAILVFGIAVITFVGCKNGENKEISSEENIQTIEAVETIDTTVVDSDNSENSLDWAGVYQGTMPCADCEGIKTILELKKDKTFILSQIYVGKPEGENEFTQKGDFAWNRYGTMIRLRSETDRFQFKVGENQLWMMNLKGNVIEGDLADKYILKKNIK